VKISKDILFWVYLWQLKEYRLDRMRAHFELPSAKKIFFNKFYFGKIILLLGSGLLFIDVWQFFFQIIAGALYSLFGLKSIYEIYRKKIREPIFTKKAVLILGLTLIPVVSISFFTYYKTSPVGFLSSILFLDLLIPLIITGIVGLIKFPSEFFKNRIIKKAKAKREALKDILVIGITGSYGKTSMKEYLAHILEGKLKVAKTKENQNTEIGVAKFVLGELTPDYDVFIVEMGAYKEGEIKNICDIVKPQIGVLTGINEQHISLFGSIEKIIKAKYELIESLPRNGLAVFNGENDYTRALYEKTDIPKRRYALRSFSVNAKPDISCEKIDFKSDEMKFNVKLQEKNELFETKLLGKHNALNILGATLVASGLGMSLGEIKERVKTLKSPTHTLDLKPGINGANIIDDSYSANPLGVMAALDVLEGLKAQKKVLVMYPLIELGSAARNIHRRIAIKINKVCDICILTSSDFAREIKKNAPNTDVFVIQDPKIAIEKLRKNIKAGDIVLLENRIPEEIKRALCSV
jgi:UDP-N-acetylmuramoyl-tripeptide--D-alanyl-D-alanine ligase